MDLRYLKNDHDLAVQDSVKRIGASRDGGRNCAAEHIDGRLLQLIDSQSDGLLKVPYLHKPTPKALVG